MQIRPKLTDQTAANGPEQTRARDRERATTAPAFRQAYADANTVTVKRGDTLMGLARQYLGGSVGQFSNNQIYEMARNVAKENGLQDANRISPGQTLNMAPMSTLNALKLRQPVVESVQLDLNASNISSPVLDKTLARAVSKGYVSSVEQGAVRDKIMSLANRHQFKPDDFARMTLMESDGMNPRSSNGSCHGIIQFCAGGNRGAASAGYAKNPKEILNLSVLKQLDLVDRYFGDTKLKDHGPAALDDLYLTVLTPSARNEKGANVPLNITGKQAAYLYEGRDQGGVITRNSIVAGLKHNARERLGEFTDTIAKVDMPEM